MEIKNLSNEYYYPSKEMQKGLNELIIFPDGHPMKNGAVNSAVWAFEAKDHKYKPKILGDDVGCGMALALFYNPQGMNLESVATDFTNYFKNNKSLGRGNHFVNICSPLIKESRVEGEPNLSDYFLLDKNYKMIIIHTDAKHLDSKKITTIDEALTWDESAKRYRAEIISDLAKRANTSCFMINDWSHNSIEENGDEIIYRKGAIKPKTDGLNFFPMSLGRAIPFYIINPRNFKQFRDSVPHGSGRVGPTSQNKVSLEKVKELREQVFIPKKITDTSLRTEHPDCYNNIDAFLNIFRDHIQIIGETQIEAYIHQI
jgi:hypothetical protein